MVAPGHYTSGFVVPLPLLVPTVVPVGFAGLGCRAARGGFRLALSVASGWRSVWRPAPARRYT